ncbi:MAG: hypothetical protein MAG795_00839 [Candidatus Woesearchaeota archaeon]|nr:hypothetical protein [Candidatus Woesearchaeota archaeon]
MIVKNNFKLVDTAVYLIRQKTLVLADIHIGYEEALNQQGILMPRFQLKDLIKHLKKILKKTNPKKIIINGDLKHEFGKISKQEWNDALLVIDLLKKCTQDVILIKGNHDTILGPIADKKNIKIVDKIILDNILITHGDKIFQKHISKIKTIIIAHQHPAIKLNAQTRSELYKCFLVGKYKNKNLIVLPSTNLLSTGTDVIKSKSISPYIYNIEKFKAYVVGDKIYDFGKISKLKQLQ